MAFETASVRGVGLGRAILIALVIVVLLSLFIPYAENALSSSSLLDSYFPLGVLLPFLFLVAVYNLLAKLVNRRLVLRTDELLAIFVVVLSGVVARSVVQRLVATIASPYYYGNPENKWPELVWPRLPGWLLPSNATGAMSRFFNGLAPGKEIPWADRGSALFWWLTFLAVIIFVCMCISVMLRRQWVEYERMEFSLARIPLELARSAGEPRLLPGVFRRRLFWVGFGTSDVTTFVGDQAQGAGFLRALEPVDDLSSSQTGLSQGLHRGG